MAKGKWMTEEKEKFARHVYELLRRQPGQTPTQLGDALGVGRMRVISALIYMEQIDLLVSEDGHGRVFPFEYTEAAYGGG